MRENLKDVLRFWMDMGADGFRADMAGALCKTVHTMGNEQFFNKTRRLIALRHSEPALADYAEFVPLYAEKDAYPFVYARACGEDVVLVLLNPRAESSSVSFDPGVSVRKLSLLMGDDFPVKVDRKGGFLSAQMPGQSYAIFKVKK